MSIHNVQIDEFSCDIRTLTRHYSIQIEVKLNHHKNNNDEKIEIN